jgi:serine/threonine protein kinase
MIEAVLRKRLYEFKVIHLLDHAHEQGMLHRDIKPVNMLLENNWLLLADFGLAKIVEGTVALTGSGVIMGTPAYMSPEQAEGKTVDHRTDIYSLGVVLYEMATGRVPYEGETPLGVVIKVIHEPLPLPRDINPDLPENVERVILKALAKDPTERFERAGETAEVLRNAVGISSLHPITPPSSSAVSYTSATQEDKADRTSPDEPRGTVTSQPEETISSKTVASLARPSVGGQSRWLWLGIGLLIVVAIAVGAIVINSARGGNDSSGTDVSSSSGPVNTVSEAVDTPTITPSSTPTPIQTSFPALNETETLTPTYSPIPIVSPTTTAISLLLEDDFSGTNGSAQALFGSGYMTFEAVDGRGQLTAISPNVVLPAMYDAPSVGDFIAEFSFQAEAATHDSAYGLIFRSDDVASGGLAYYYHLVIKPANGVVNLNAWDGTWVAGSAFTVEPGVVRPTDTNHVRLEVVGSNFRLFINGVFVFEHTDTTLTAPGIFGLSIVSTQESETVYFDNLKIYAVP